MLQRVMDGSSTPTPPAVSSLASSPRPVCLVSGDGELELLAQRIASTAAAIDAACHRLLTDLRRFDAEEGWARHGALSAAHWLNWRCGISLGAAREKVRVAHALAKLPLIDAALARGHVSYSKVRALTRVATPENEELLLEMAGHTTASQLERTCRLLVQMQAPEPPADAPPARWVRVHDTGDGMVRLEARLRPEEAERVLAACDVSAEARPDGLVAIADAALRGNQPERPPVEVLVEIDASTLAGRTAQSGVPAETARRLLCDAGVVPVLCDEAGAPLSVGRRMRSLPAALRRALLMRDGACRFPGCTHRRHVDGHHIRHWAHGGETSLQNTLLLCSVHHGAVHEGGFRVEGSGAHPRFFAPDGTELTVTSTPSVTPGPLPASAPHPTWHGWDGGPVDWDAVTSALLS
jgi:hypothetical protein